MPPKHRSKALRRLKAKRLILLVLGLAVLGGGVFLLNRYQVERQAGSLIERGETAAEKQDWPAAAGHYQTYLNIRPKDTDALARYAEILEEVAKTKPGAVADLIRTYTRLLAEDSSRTVERRKLARYSVAVRYYSGARTELDRMIAAGPDAELYELLATCDEAERKFPEAVGTLRKAITTGKAAPETSLRLALILRNEIKTPEAEEEADQVLNALVAARKDDVRARLTRAHYRAQSGRTNLAREDLEYAFHKIPGGATDPEIVIALAELATSPEQVKSARDALNATAALHPNDVRVRIGLAELQARTNETESAKRNFAAVVKQITQPNAQLFRVADRLLDLGDIATATTQAARFVGEQQYLSDYLNGRAKLSQGEWPDALPLLHRAVAGPLTQFKAQYLKAQLALAECHKHANNPDARLKAFDTVLAIDPKSVVAQLGRAECLTRTGNMAEAIKALQPHSRDVPAARVELARLHLATQRLRAEADRNWNEFERAIGPEPWTAELAILKATALFLQRRPADGIALLEKLTQSAPDLPAPRIAFATASLAMNKRDAALEILDKAEKDLGDRVDFRLTRAQLMALSATPNPAAVISLGQNSAKFPQHDRFVLAHGLGEILLALGKPKDAIAAFTRAAAENANDVSVRMLLFDLAVIEKEAALQEQMLTDFDRIEGVDGPTRMIAEVTRALQDVKPGDKVRTAALRARTLAARANRDNWPRIFVVLGDLDRLDGNSDTAAEHYRKAYRLGDRSQPLVVVLVRILMERQAHAEAYTLLAEMARVMPLTHDLLRQYTLLRTMFGDDTNSITWTQGAANSKEPRDHLARAAIFSANNAPEEAHRALEQALALPDAPPEAWVALVRVLMALGKKSDAMAATEQAEKRLPDVHVIVGNCRELTGDTTKAEQLYRKAYSARPTDPVANETLVGFLMRTARRPEAEELLNKHIAGDAPPPLRRWARRALAFSRVSQPDGYGELPQALELIESNLREGGNLLDDQRAKAIVLAADPFRRAEAIELLTATTQAVPLTADQNYYLAKMYLLQNRADRAEAALVEATKATVIASTEHLALLARVQVQRSNLDGARKTIARLKTVAPGSWEAMSEDARLLAASSQKAEAGKLALAWSTDTAVLAGRVGPLLEELGCVDDAEKAFRDALTRGKPPAHVALFSHYVRVGRGGAALTLAREHAATSPAGMTAKMFASAARAQPSALVPDAERPTWAAAVADAETWVRTRLTAEPTNPDLLIAMAGFDDLAGRYDEEITRYEQVLVSQPDNEIILNNLALLLALHHRDGGEKPLALVNRAIAKRGPRTTYLDTRAVVYTVAGRYEEAIRDLTIAIGLEPKAGYYFHLALVYDKLAETKRDAVTIRDSALREAVARGLTKMKLHAKEWSDFDRLLPHRKGN